MKLLPSEVKAKFIIPSVRREISKKMHENGFKQTEIARELGITQSAISQYLKEKRAICDFEIDSHIEEELEKSVKNISNSEDPFAAPQEIERICNILEEEGILCEVHRKNENLPDECGFCG